MIHPPRVRALFVLVPLLLAACVADKAPPSSHADRGPGPKLRLDVQQISLADRSGIQPYGSPYNTNHFSPTIAQAIKQWAGDRLQAVGSGGQAIIVIKDASLTAQALPVNRGFDAWFTRQQAVKYIGHADVSVEASGRQGFATTEATANRSVTLPENPSAIEKQDAYFTLLNGLMKDLGENLENGITAHMAPFVATGAAPASPMTMTAPPAPMAMPVQPVATAYAPPAPPAPPQIPSTPLLTTVSESTPAATDTISGAPVALVTTAPAGVAPVTMASMDPLKTVSDAPAVQQPPPTPIAPQPFSGYTDATYPNAAHASAMPATIPISQNDGFQGGVSGMGTAQP